MKLGISILALHLFLTLAGAAGTQLSGTWDTDVTDREGTEWMKLTLVISEGRINWSVRCQLIGGDLQEDSVSTAAQISSSSIQIVENAGNFGRVSGPCELGISRKPLSYTSTGDRLVITDYAGTVRVFTRR